MHLKTLDKQDITHQTSWALLYQQRQAQRSKCLVIDQGRKVSGGVEAGTEEEINSSRRSSTSNTRTSDTTLSVEAGR